MKRDTVIPIIMALLFAVQFAAKASAEESGAAADEGWRTIESRYCTILCHPDVDVEKVNHQIKITFHDIFLERSADSRKDKGIEGQLAEKFDRIFHKVEKILDMFPRRLHLTVKIYSTPAQLEDAYGQIFGSANAAPGISYYVHKYTTIYITQPAISHGTIAHEIGHAVLDHYFLILPPPKIGELLARYVETHLED